MAVNPEVFYTGNGTKTDYTFSFEYIDEDDIKVSIDDVVTTAYSFANATTILFNSAPANLSRIRIYRDTNIDSLKTTFFAGSSIRAQDLNQNFEQNNYAVQEIKAYTWDNETDTIHSDETWVSSDTQIATTAAMDQRFQDEVNDTLTKAELAALSDVIPDNDDAVPTTGAVKDYVDHVIETDILVDGTGLNKTGSGGQVTIGISAGSVDLDRIKAEDIITSAESNPNNDTTIATTAKIDDMIDAAITSDIGTDGTGITVTDDGDGTITLGLADNTIDFSKIKNADIITYAEQPTVATSDNNIFTASAAERQFDTIVQTTTPTGTDYEVGKTWLQNDSDKTLSIWNGSAWVAVASGGAFTELGKVVYVDATNGDDSLAGHRISNPKRTIKAAMDQINAETDAVGNGSLVIVAPGIYAEEFPITIQKNDVSVVGTSLRNCIIHPAIGVTAATAAVNGSEYRIRFVGTTDFTAIGAPDNVVGTVFTATGAGTGTGTLEDTAVQAAYDVDVPEANELSTMFQVNSGTYIQNLTLQGMKGNGTRGGNVLDTDATFGLPTQQGWNFAFFPGATIRKSPYIQNCTNFSDSQINNVNFTPHVPGEGAAGDLDSGGFSGGGILIDGDTVAANSPLRSMVCDSYTHTALNGPGIFVTNNGYTQVTSSYAFFTHYHLKCLNGGQANLAASTSDFGRYSLIADGRSTTNIFTADLTVNAADQATTFTIGQPTADASWHGNATRPQPNMLVQLNGITYPILSSVANGLGWDVTISRPDPANRSNNLGLNGAVNTPATAQFFLRSQVASSGHTMEYVGSGTDYRALPENATGTFPVGANDPVTADATAGNAPCGVPVEDRQTIVLNNGAIWTAVTDHNGKFRVGGDQVNDPTYEVDQQLGRVTFRTGSLSIPNLISNLDTNGFNIFDSTGHVNINDELDVNNNKIVNLAAPTANSDAATKLYVDSQVSVADKIEEGNSKVEVVDTGNNGTIIFTNEGTESARIVSKTRTLFGADTVPTIRIAGSDRTDSSHFFVKSGTNLGGALNVVHWSGNSSASWGTDFVLAKSFSGTVGTHVAPGTSSLVSRMSFTASDGTRFVPAATIEVRTDGTVGDLSMPGELSFRTTAASGSIPTERMTINSSGAVQFQDGTAANPVISFLGDSNTGLYRPGSDVIGFATGAGEQARIDNQGRLLVGTSSARSNIYMGGASDVPKVQFEHSGNNYSGQVSLIQYTSAGTAPTYTIGISKSNTPGTNAVVASGDTLGTINFVGNDGTNFRTAAQIQAGVDGTPGTNDMPGRLVFKTTADGASSPTERMRITSSGNVQISQQITDTSGNSLIRGNTSNLTIYVSNSGSDSTGDGSSSSPYRTVNHAAKQIPDIVTRGVQYQIRVLGSSYTPSGSDNIKGKQSPGEYQAGYAGRIQLYADTAGCTWDLNSGSLYIQSNTCEIRIERFAFQCADGTATGMIDVTDCGYVNIMSTNTFTSGHQGGWAYSGGLWCRRCDHIQMHMDFSFTSAATGGYGGPIIYENCRFAYHGGDVIKSGTQHADQAVTFINGTDGYVAGTISNFATGIRCGANHYQSETGGYIAVNGATISNCSTGISAEHGSHVRTRSVTYSGNTTNTSYGTNSYIG